MSGRNVVLVTIDSLRADHCGYVNGQEQERSLTPELDAMATEGVSFENAIAPGPSTYESMPAILTGDQMCEYPTGDGDALDRRGEQIRLNTRRETVAERFAARGYDTAAFTTNPYTGRHSNFARGFERFEDFLDGGEGPLMRRAAHLPVLSEAKHLVTLLRGDRASKPWHSYYDDVLQWVCGASEPYFLWVFLLDAHTPYLVPDEYREGSKAGMYYHNWRFWAAQKWGLDLAPDPAVLASLYRGTVRSVDAFLGRLRQDVEDDPIIAVHADHGEAFGEHDTFGHEAALYEENVHVPLVLSNTDKTGRVRDPVSLTALPELLSGASTDSVSVPDSDYALSRTFGPRHLALRGRDWKYITTVSPEAEIAGEELYDLAADPGERVNVAADRPVVIESCRARCRRRLAHEREARAVYRATGEVA